MKIEVFPDAQLGGERDLAEGTRLGTVDMAVAAAGSVLPLWVPEFQIVEMPFLFRDRARAYKVLDGTIIYSGTLAALTGGFVYGTKLYAELADPKLNRSLAVEYKIHSLDAFK
jgi:hypothetical protein